MSPSYFFILAVGLETDFLTSTPPASYNTHPLHSTYTLDFLSSSSILTTQTPEFRPYPSLDLTASPSMIIAAFIILRDCHDLHLPQPNTSRTAPAKHQAELRTQCTTRTYVHFTDPAVDYRSSV